MCYLSIVYILHGKYNLQTIIIIICLFNINLPTFQIFSQKRKILTIDCLMSLASLYAKMSGTNLHNRNINTIIKKASHCIFLDYKKKIFNCQRSFWSLSTYHSCIDHHAFHLHLVHLCTSHLKSYFILLCFTSAVKIVDYQLSNAQTCIHLQWERGWRKSWLKRHTPATI